MVFCICVCCFLLSFLYTPLFLFLHLPARSAFASLSTFFYTLVGVVRYFVRFGIPEGRGLYKGKRGKGRKERKMDVDYESSGGDATKEWNRIGQKGRESAALRARSPEGACNSCWVAYMYEYVVP